MNKFSNQRGSITLYVLLSMLFFLIVTGAAFISMKTKEANQDREIARIQQSYEKKENIINIPGRYSINFYPNSNLYVPSDYQEIDYIESTGTQYIDTGYKPTKNTGIEATFQFTATTVQQRVFGSDSSTSTDDLFSFSFYINGSGKWAYSYQDKKGNWVNLGINANTSKHTLRFNVENDKSYFITNTSQTVYSNLSGTSTMTSSAHNIYIFGANRPGTSSNTSANFADAAKLKIFDFKIYENGELVKHYVPCFRIRDGAVGFYEIVDNHFYSGDFKKEDTPITTQRIILGKNQSLVANSYENDGYMFSEWNTKPDGTGTSYTDEQIINELEEMDDENIINLYAIWSDNSYKVTYYPNRIMASDYKETEYIEGVGAQYINTSYYPTANTGIEMDYRFRNTSIKQQVIFGVKSANTLFYQVYINGNGKMAYAYQDGSGNWIATSGVPDLVKRNICFNKTLGSYSIDGGKITQGTISGTITTTSDYPLCIMAARTGDNTYGGYSYMRLYNLKIYESEELKEVYVPCYRVSDNLPGLYNTINNNFYPSETAGMLKGKDPSYSQSFTIGKSQELDENKYINDGFSFVGWNTKPDGTGASYNNKQSIINLTSTVGGEVKLYAQWVKND